MCMMEVGRRVVQLQVQGGMLHARSNITFDCLQASFLWRALPKAVVATIRRLIDGAVAKKDAVCTTKAVVISLLLLLGGYK